MLSGAQIDELKQQVVDACHILAAERCVRVVTGHVSVRIPGTTEMLLRCRRPNDPGVEFTIFDDIRRLEIEGRGFEVVDGYEKPGEFAIHSEIYKHRPDVGAVVHGHPRASLLCGILNLPLLPMVGAYDPGMLEIALLPPPVFPRAVLIQTPDLGKQMVDALGNANAILLQGHGVVTVGRDVPEATLRAVRLEALAELTLEVHASGREATLLAQRDIDELMPNWNERSQTYTAWAWEFYRRKLGRPIAV